MATAKRDTVLNVDKRQQKLPPIQLREVLADLVYVWLHNDGWLQDTDAETARKRAADKDVSMRNLVEWAIKEGIVAEDDVIPF